MSLLVSNHIKEPTSSFNQFEQPFEVEVDAFVNSANQVANDILNKVEYRGSDEYYRPIGRVHVHHFWSWWPMTPVYVDPCYSRRGCVRTQESDNTLNWIVGIVAAVLGGYAIFKAIEGYNHRKEASEELRDNRRFQAVLRNYALFNPNAPHLEEVKQVSEIKHRIFARIKSDANRNLAFMVSLVAFSALTLLGAIASSGGLMLAGIAFCIGTGTAMLFSSATDNTARHHVRDARLIRSCLLKMRHQRHA